MLKRVRRLGFDRRIQALEVSLGAQPDVGAKVVGRANLPERDKQILLRALRDRVVVVTYEELDRLNAAIDALPAAQRARLNQVAEAAIIVAVSGADLGL